MGISIKTLDQSRKAYRVLAANGRPAEKRCITYGDLAAQIGMAHHRPLRFALHRIQDECRLKGWPTITILVVKKGSRLPGEGCDSHNPSDFDKTVDEVAKAAWPLQLWR